MTVTADRVARLEAFVDTQARVLDLIGATESIERVLQELTRSCDEQIPGTSATILLDNDDGSIRRVGPEPDGSGRTTPIVGSDGDELGMLVSTGIDPTYEPSGFDQWLQQQFARLVRVAIERHRDEQRLALIVADERRKLAENLHDDPIQVVTAANLRLQRLARTANDDQREIVDDVQQSLTKAIGRMRRMLFELHPPSLDDDGIAGAIENYLSEIMDPIDIDWELEEELDCEPTPEMGSLAYRLAREALWNAAKHADATKVTVSIRLAANRLGVRIVDDGNGFNPRKRMRSAAKHLGMNSCRDLARRASGTWDVTSSPGHGTVVEFTLPASSS